MQHRVSLAALQKALLVYTKGGRVLPGFKLHLIIGKLFPLTQRAIKSGVPANAKFHLLCIVVLHGEAGRKPVFAQLVLYRKGKCIRVQRLGGFAALQHKPHPVFGSLCRAKLGAAGKPVPGISVGLPVNVDFTPQQYPHHGEQQRRVPRPIGFIPLPKVRRTVCRRAADQFAPQCRGPRARRAG